MISHQQPEQKEQKDSEQNALAQLTEKMLILRKALSTPFMGGIGLEAWLTRGEGESYKTYIENFSRELKNLLDEYKAYQDYWQAIYGEPIYSVNGIFNLSAETGLTSGNSKLITLFFQKYPPIFQFFKSEIEREDKLFENAGLAYQLALDEINKQSSQNNNIKESIDYDENIRIANQQWQVNPQQSSSASMVQQQDEPVVTVQFKLNEQGFFSTTHKQYTAVVEKLKKEGWIYGGERGGQFVKLSELQRELEIYSGPQH